MKAMRTSSAKKRSPFLGSAMHTKIRAMNLLWAQLACLLHALLVCGNWVLVFKFDRDAIPGKPWMVLALGWLLWPLAIALARQGKRVQWTIVITIGALLIAPTFPTLYTYVTWFVEGFAP
jgi:hypothetical protein